MCECFARCEADCVCDHDWTPPELTAARERIASLEAERDQLRDVLWRGGFVMCDIPACNCGSWHHKYGLPERFREIADGLAEAGHELCNENGNLPIRALKSLAAERDQLRAELAECRAAASDAAHMLEIARVWGGLDWSWTNLHHSIAKRAWEKLTAALAAREE